MKNMTPFVIIILVALMFVLLFAAAKSKGREFRIQEQDSVIHALAEKNDEYKALLAKKNDSIRLLERQLQILNDEVARMHGRSSDSFINN